MALIDTKDIRQSDSFDCGAVAADVACRVHGVCKRKGYFRHLLGTNGINGTDPRTIEAFIRLEGLKVLSGEMDIHDLQFMTRRGKPVITLVTFETCGHYIVVRGVTGTGRNKFVHFHDPETGRQKMPANEFIEVWRDYDRFGVSYKQFGIVVWE